MRMPVLKIALTGFASVALASTAVAGGVFNAGADLFNSGADLFNAGADVFNAGADLFNGHYYDQYYNHQYYNDSYYYVPIDTHQPGCVSIVNCGGSGAGRSDRGGSLTSHMALVSDRNYPTAAVCRTQHLPWRHGSYKVHVCYGNRP
jgi:hypothetical protein